jgi:tetratricopeptide (TPR) repeat protein
VKAVVRAALVVAAMLLMPALAHAGFADLPRHPEAYRALQLGNRAFELARWDEAVAEYERGAMLEPAPLFWRNIALAHRSAGRTGEAARAYRAYLRRIADDDTAARERARVEALLVDLDAEAAKEPAATGPALIPAVATAPASSNESTNTNTQQVHQHVTIATQSEPRPARGRRLGIGLVSGGVAMGVLSGLFASWARSQANDANEEPDQRRQRDLRDAAQRDRTAAIFAGGAGGALLVAGALVWWAPWEDDSPVVVRPGPGDAGVAVELEF